MDVMILATELNLVGKLIYDYLFVLFKDLPLEASLIGAFGLTVIVFTFIVKLVTLPLDIWQKSLGRKNVKIMERMKPELDVITKQCGTNKELLMQKQRALYKENHYSALSSCLPMIVMLVMFGVIFGGFNSVVRHHNSLAFDNLNASYKNAYTLESEKLQADNATLETPLTDAQINEKSILKAEEAVLSMYKPERFLLTTNIFMSDNWSSPVPSAEIYSGTGMGQLGIKDVDKNTYDAVMKPIFAKYNFNADGGKVWNGYLILPILSFLISILSSKLVKPPEQPAQPGQTEEQKKMMANQQKMMQYMMPFMFAIFTLFYSAAFTIYMLLSNVISAVFNLIYNAIAKKQDAAEKDRILTSTIKK